MDADALHAHVVQQYAQHLNPYLAKLMNFAGFGVEMRGEGCYLYDHEGRQFLDCLGSYGVFTLGHRHPKVVQAVKDQLDRLPLSGKVFFNPVQAQLAERLATLAPKGLDYAFFSNSGAEAVEAAVKFAKGATGREKILSTENGYHGKTVGALSVTGREKYRKKFGSLMPGGVFLPYNDLDAMMNALDEQTAAVIVEVVQGEGGIHVADARYLHGIRERTKEVGALMIVDEVQTGMGRTGTLFACEHYELTPDLLTLAKALGGGVMPIGATLGTAAVWEAVFSENPLMHTSTFGGNPLACAAGIAALEATLEDGVMEHGKKIGELLMNELRAVQSQRSDLIGEVRGLGMMIGIEFTMDEVGELVIAQMTKRGVIAAYTLNNPRVIRIEPPLLMTEEQAKFAVSVFADAVAETADLLAAIA